ncbi:hypothetical protein NIES2101_25570 [Calothrix sp. HK-06]|nr:hypothetical protein NIES2101_25570 [Calothrix sp. HK-06]
MNFSPLLRVQGEHLNHLHVDNVLAPAPEATINRLFRLVATDTSLSFTAEFYEAWRIKEFSLGDELMDYQSPKDTLYVVCSGRVRLLGYEQESARNVSAQLLDVGESFGADELFYRSLLPYRAVAATNVAVAELGKANLKIWLQRAENFESYLVDSVETRQKLIFWKTCTSLRSLTSQTLQYLSPYFALRTVNTGELLASATPVSEGRYWLMSGHTEQQDAQVGYSWGYPDVASPAFKAETELVVCHLPVENWELVKPFLPSQNFQEENRQVELYEVELHQVELNQVELNQVESNNIQTVTSFELGNSTYQNSQKYNKQKYNKKYPFIAQQSSSDCGAACLAMICKYWGKKVSLNTLRRSCQTNRIGATLSSLADAAVNLGYSSVAVQANLTALAWRHSPWIAHWQGNHYVVVWGVRSNYVVISDPAVGKLKLPISEFEANWTGYALMLEPTERLQQLLDEKTSLVYFWQSLWKYQSLVLQIVIASLVMQVFGLVMPVIAQIVIDKVIPARMSVALNIFALGFLVFGIWRYGIKTARQYLLDYFSNHMDISLMSDFIRHVLELPLQFFEQRQAGDIISRVEENHKIQTFLTRRAFGITLDALCAFLCLALIAYYNSHLALLVLALTVPVAVFTINTSQKLKRISRELAIDTAVQNHTVNEMITGITTIKSFGASRWMRWHWEERFVNTIKTRLCYQRLSNNLQLTNNLINHASSTLVLWYAASLMIHDQLSFGKFIAFTMLVSSIINPVLALVELKNDIHSVVVSIERLNDVLLSSPEIRDEELELPPIQGEVRFENVSFHYQGEERNALQNISFVIKPGQTVGIVGASGAGKTTLLNLVCGLYKPDSGRILIDGHDICTVSSQTLLTQLGVVPASIFIFSGTVLENITLFSPFTFEEVKNAARTAGAHDFIESLPSGYDTLIGASAKTLSKKQHYLIAIARALIRKPRMLILDEPTSALDVQTENLLKQNLSRGALGCTTFIVSHRLNHLSSTDRILVLDRGIIVEIGRHHELFAKSQLYSHLVVQ